jgi:hypothetical protein
VYVVNLRAARRCRGVAAVWLLAVAFAACADENAEVKTVTVERQIAVVEDPPPEKRDRPKARSLSRKTAPRPAEFVNCDSNIEAKADNTTCPFAQNLFWTYWTSGESGGPLAVWSPAAQTSFTTTCAPGEGRVVCNTSDGGVVRFPQAAVDAYSQSQADAYAGSHDLGPDPYEGLPEVAPPEDSPGPEGGDCQGYDPCLAPGPDVDCEGGSGNGPRYVAGPVDVVGYDPYGLDADGDGIGCDY